MPFVANTPESYLNRSDSKATNGTCRGLTSNGRPCRRAVQQTAPKTDKRGRPVTPDPRDESLYCWQHREQANMSAHSSPGPRATSTPILEGRTSLDTLADRLGLVDLQEKKKHRRDTDGRKQTAPRPKPQPKQSLMCCCFSVPLQDVQESRPSRPQPRPVQKTSASVPPKRASKQHLTASQNTSSAKNSRRSRKSTGSQTAQIKDFIPDSVDAQTASALMSELARPFGTSEEPGFIYMFWLTPTSQSSSAPVDAARSLLSPPSPNRPPRSRSASNAVSSFAAADPSTSKNTMLLKIGRAANVQRRLNQWQRQCGHEVEILRYYPYLPGSQESSGVVPHMTQHVHRVERLVHIELAGMGLKKDAEKCDACGREHREWFEVEATREGIKAVDGVIRRWIEWDETMT
ncbi:hypothetical protein FOVG_08713 [Fusarium oxysporum f. sp. pisi HDV247]|uniref:Bacteriophage T5 Orf172 DNA-binding domain-containing protein n=1 Tax=Fusarium oxysporum f. sp. pisi HDV247 TaxID=1080344 RepID=W9PNN0_FUSOX|nr:hypothetical protein FOVG_08713 [Fusarium oxysporum f. sp. pisi HDV247]WKT41841.1 phage DNA binding protein [Fusarium oxysporum f. sp. vasinfectum]